MTKCWINLIFGASALVLAGCSSGGPPAPQTAILRDDFTGPACRFGSLEGTASFGYGCADGEFRAWIDNDQAAYDFISAPAGETFGDVRIEVDARFESGVEAGAYLLCRGSQASGNFYVFRVGVDSLAEITDFLSGEEQVARLFPMPEGALRSGTNHLRADCIGDTLSLFVNGSLMLERSIEGSVYGTGDVGLGAGGGSQGLSAVRFDNLVVTSP
ncbi:MAG TPA: hypothetical protein VJ160_02400 [Anaerolineales bacterium]|nr:hypothetical protein [Anaerolineales bacterium]